MRSFRWISKKNKYADFCEKSKDIYTTEKAEPEKGIYEMIDSKLQRIINTGRCLAFVGSGPSCEMGYHSWEKLAKDTYEVLKKNIANLDNKSYEKYLRERKYPEFFGAVERAVGSRDNLISILIPLLQPKSAKDGKIYEFITHWPFACYITTNFDDEINSYLKKKNIHYKVLKNSKEDLCAIHDGMSHLIFKIHSDFALPKSAVITDSDYSFYYSDDGGKYYRDKVRQLFELFDIVIIGHSLYDPDISYILQLAKNTASPQHPIYMFMADATEAEMTEYRKKYNINLLGYSNNDGKHSNLRKMLSTYNKFIFHGQDRNNGIENQPSEYAELATSLYIYRTLAATKNAGDVSNIILSSLPRFNEEPISEKDIQKKIKIEINSIHEKLQILVESGNALVEMSKYKCSPSGTNIFDECKNIRKLEKEHAYEQLIDNIQQGIWVDCALAAQ